VGRLPLEERVEIKAGSGLASLRSIAHRLDRHPTTIMREIERNAFCHGRYRERHRCGVPKKGGRDAKPRYGATDAQEWARRPKRGRLTLNGKSSTAYYVKTLPRALTVGVPRSTTRLRRGRTEHLTPRNLGFQNSGRSSRRTTFQTRPNDPMLHSPREPRPLPESWQPVPCVNVNVEHK
jgi:hypothetical protein